MASLTRRVVGTITSLLIAVFAATALAAPAHGEDGYQYWNYFHLEGDTWAFAQTGPADHQPEDGDVEGFRYGVSTPSQGIEPRADLDEVNFDTICADTEAAEGEKRVAVVLDYGTDEGNGTAPDPRAECAVVDEGASSQDILGEIADVRAEGGLVCALDGYPATGCGEPVPDADVPADEEPVAFALPSDDTADADGTADAAAEEATEEGGSSPVLIIALVVVLIAAAAVVLNRRRSKTV